MFRRRVLISALVAIDATVFKLRACQSIICASETTRILVLNYKVLPLIFYPLNQN